MIVNRTINTAKNVSLLTAGAFGAYKLISQKLFDLTFKKNDIECELSKQHIDWLNKSNKADCYIKSYDGLNLHGLKIENNNTNDYIILVHGIWSNMLWMIPWAYELDKLGYNIFLVDQRASGKSDGEYYTYGLKESFDLIKWTNYLISVNENINIIYFGVSMGAATCMMTTNGVLPNNVKCIIEDCGFSSLKEELAHVLKGKYKIAKPYLVLNIFESIMYSKLGFNFNDVKPAHALQQNDLPLLIIHGEDDRLIPFKMSKIIYNYQKGTKKFYSVKGAHHAKAITDKKYFYHIDNFIKNFA